MFCIDFICLPHILQGKNYHVQVFGILNSLCHPGAGFSVSSWGAGPPHSCVILGLDPRIQVMEAVAQRHISHSLDRHGRTAPSR